MVWKVIIKNKKTKAVIITQCKISFRRAFIGRISALRLRWKREQMTEGERQIKETAVLGHHDTDGLWEALVFAPLQTSSLHPQPHPPHCQPTAAEITPSSSSCVVERGVTLLRTITAFFNSPSPPPACPYFWSAQRSLRGRRFFMWWLCESSGASVAMRLTKTFFFCWWY